MFPRTCLPPLCKPLVSSWGSACPMGCVWIPKQSASFTAEPHAWGRCRTPVGPEAQPAQPLLSAPCGEQSPEHKVTHSETGTFPWVLLVLPIPPFLAKRELLSLLHGLEVGNMRFPSFLPPHVKGVTSDSCLSQESVAHSNPSAGTLEGS